MKQLKNSLSIIALLLIVSQGFAQENRPVKKQKVDEKNKLKKMRVNENFWVKSVQNPKLCLVYLNKNEKIFFQKMF